MAQLFDILFPSRLLRCDIWSSRHIARFIPLAGRVTRKETSRSLIFFPLSPVTPYSLQMLSPDLMSGQGHHEGFPSLRYTISRTAQTTRDLMPHAPCTKHPAPLHVPIPISVTRSSPIPRSTPQSDLHRSRASYESPAFPAPCSPWLLVACPSLTLQSRVHTAYWLGHYWPDVQQKGSGDET